MIFSIFFIVFNYEHQIKLCIIWNISNSKYIYVLYKTEIETADWNNRKQSIFRIVSFVFDYFGELNEFSIPRMKGSFENR